MARKPLTHRSAYDGTASGTEGRDRHVPAFETVVRVPPRATPVVAVRGELDLAVARAFEELVIGVIGRHGPDVVIDVSGLEFCDARGLGALVRCANAADRSGGRLTLARPGSRLRRLINLVGLDRLL
jgi:anti-anti-sigma factor